MLTDTILATSGLVLASFSGTTYEEMNVTVKNHFDLYGNFDIIFDHFSRTSQLHTTQHAPCAILYFVPMLIGC